MSLRCGVMKPTDVIPGMNAMAFTREVRSAAQLRRWLARLEGWAAGTIRAAILRGSPKTASTSG
jgi:hypothetical protein